MEIRSNKNTIKLEQRSSGQQRIMGYGSVFHRPGDDGTQFRLGEGVVERISPRAFDRAIREGHDCRALLNHDANAILGRTKSGTLRLMIDNVGLRFVVDVPKNTPFGVTAIEACRRGDITGSSFAFTAIRVTYLRDGKLSVRLVEDLELHDISVVCYPAYEASTAALVTA